MTDPILAQNGEPEDWRSSCTDHLDRMSYTLEHGLFADVSLIVGSKGEVVRGHRLILSIGSPVFQAMLTGKPFEDEKPIKIPKVQPCGFKPLLKYFYTGKIPEIPEEDYIEFLRAVKYFKVQGLYKICREHILKKLALENAIDVYEISKVLEEKEIEEVADTFIKKNAESVLAQPKFTELSAEDLLHFISSDDFSAPEVPLCRAVHKWGEAECDRQHLEKCPENLRLVLKTVIPQIRFPLMNSEDFAVEIAKLTLPNHDETAAVHNYFFARQHKRHQIPEEGRFISRPRKRVKYSYDDPDGVDNIVWNLDGINTGLRAETVYTISNKGVSSPNYLNVYSTDFGVVATENLTTYEFGGPGYLSTFWVIRHGSEPNAYTLFSKYKNGYLSNKNFNYNPSIIGPKDKKPTEAENLTFEPSKNTPGYFLLTSRMNHPNSGKTMVLSLEETMMMMISMLLTDSSSALSKSQMRRSTLSCGQLKKFNNFNQIQFY